MSWDLPCKDLQVDIVKQTKNGMELRCNVKVCSLMHRSVFFHILVFGFRGKNLIWQVFPLCSILVAQLGKNLIFFLFLVEIILVKQSPDRDKSHLRKNVYSLICKYAA